MVEAINRSQRFNARTPVEAALTTGIPVQFDPNLPSIKTAIIPKPIYNQTLFGFNGQAITAMFIPSIAPQLSPDRAKMNFHYGPDPLRYSNHSVRKRWFEGFHAIDIALVYNLQIIIQE